MTEEESSDLDVQLEWPQADEPEIRGGKGRAETRRARRRARSRALPPAQAEIPAPVQILSERIDLLARAVTALGAQLSEHAARVDALRDQTEWDSQKLLAKLEVLRDSTSQLRQVRERMSKFVKARADLESALVSQVGELTQQVEQLREGLAGGGLKTSTDPDAVNMIAKAVAASLRPKPTRRTAKKAARTTKKR